MSLELWLAFRTLCVLSFYFNWICPELALKYHEGSRVFLSSFEAEGERVLSGRNIAASEVVKNVVESGNYTAASPSDDLDHLVASTYVVVLA